MHPSEDRRLEEEPVREDAPFRPPTTTQQVCTFGLPDVDESEGFDRTHLDLPANQTVLVARLAAANPNLVVVLANGSAVRLSHWEQHAPTILECWLSGQAAGGAVADLLTGAANPSGRLAETLPLRLEDNPSYLNFPGEQGHVRYGEGVFVGYRSYDALDLPVSYPFGHGLSYTSFEYADLKANLTGNVEDDTLAVAVTCTVTNTGRRPGKEVVQLYVVAPDSSVRGASSVTTNSSGSSATSRSGPSPPSPASASTTPR